MTEPIPIGPTLSQIGQIFVNVKDLDRAVAFYRDTLGMTFLFTAPPGMAFFDCGGIRIMMGKADRPEIDHPASIIYYKVEDIEKVYEVFNARATWRSASDQWEVALEATNLADKYYYLTKFDLWDNGAGYIHGQPSRPREYAMTVKRSF